MDSKEYYYAYGGTIMDKRDLHVSQRMAALMKPIEKQIMMCDDDSEIMMLACAMLSTAKRIMDNRLGLEGRREMFREMNALGDSDRQEKF